MWNLNPFEKPAQKALKKALNKPDVLNTPMQRMLILLVLKELSLAFAKLSSGERLPIHDTGLISFYLRKGYATFQDLGISKENEVHFFNFHVITISMFKEIVKVPEHFASAVAEGEHRKNEYQHGIYVSLTHKEMSRRGI